MPSRLANGAEGIGNGSARDIDDGSDVGLSELLIAAWMEAFSEGRTSSSRPGVDRRAGLLFGVGHLRQPARSIYPIRTTACLDSDGWSICPTMK